MSTRIDVTIKNIPITVFVQSGWFLFGTELWAPMFIVMGLYTALYSIFGLLSVLYSKKVIKEAL